MKFARLYILPALASLRLTVVLLALAMMVVFMATLAQTELGIWEVMRRYIRTFIVWVQLPGGHVRLPIFPGGWLLGGLLLVNLIAAHAVRFSLSWKKAPLLLIHSGLALLLLGELITGWFGRETQMTLDEGQTLAYAEAPREAELAIVDSSSLDFDEVWSIPESRLVSGKPIREESLPFAVKVDRYYRNSRLAGGRVEELPPVVTTDGRNIVSAIIDLVGRDGSTGPLLVSAALDQPQIIELGGRRFQVAIRQRRFYKPYSIELLKFSHERHPGTEVPRAFSSRVRVKNPARDEDREVLISMNQPLRYGGDALYQASFANNERTSILQVVRNPGWLMPYIACAMVAAGLVWQFSTHLVRGAGKRPVRSTPACGTWMPPWATAAALIAIIWLVAGLWHRPPSEGPDFRAFGQLPVMADGRLKCFDTLARGSMLAMQGKSTIETPAGERLGATEWLLAVLTRPETADAYPVFLVHHPEVLALLKQPPAAKRILSFDHIRPAGAEVQSQSELAERTKREERTTFQRAIRKLEYSLTLYWRLRHSLHMGNPFSLGEIVEAHDREIRPVARRMQEEPSGPFSDEEVSRVYQAAVRYGVLSDMAQFRPVPYYKESLPNGEWVPLGESLMRSLSANALAPPVLSYKEILAAFASGRMADFNMHVRALQVWMDEHFPAAARRARIESAFNSMNLFVKSAALYIAVFLFVCVSWMAWPRVLGSLALMFLGVAFFGHTAGLALRMYLQERPPVTSLYASAIFVGWAAVLLGLILERFCRNGLGTSISALSGFTTLIIAYNLTDGDTVEVMRAVLDSNFWLATHVVVITIGYAASFVAGTLGVAYLVRRALPASMTPEQAKSHAGMIYGVVCFALLFSFVGTILGGIWADQSWGRFWGWDPKENGALLIVLCHAITLHLRWGRLVSDHGLAACAVFGNIVTSFSWFGVNMLGVGLHSYGFMDGAPFWLGLFVASQLAAMALATLPSRFRRSHELEQAAAIRA